MECHFDTERVTERMSWRHVVKLTLTADDIMAKRKEQQDKMDLERAVAAQPGGGWGRL